MRRAFALVTAGRSLAKAAEILTAETGRRWMPTTIARMIAREEYKLAAEWRIVTPAKWKAAQESAASRRKVKAPAQPCVIGGRQRGRAGLPKRPEVTPHPPATRAMPATASA